MSSPAAAAGDGAVDAAAAVNTPEEATAVLVPAVADTGSATSSSGAGAGAPDHAGSAVSLSAVNMSVVGSADAIANAIANAIAASPPQPATRQDRQDVIRTTQFRDPAVPARPPDHIQPARDALYGRDPPPVPPAQVEHTSSLGGTSV